MHPFKNPQLHVSLKGNTVKSILTFSVLHWVICDPNTKKEDVVYLPMIQLSTRDQMTQKLTVKGQPFRNCLPQWVGYKRPRTENRNAKHFKRENFCTKNEQKTNM